MRKISFLFLIILVSGCAAIQVQQSTIELLKSRHNIPGDFIEVNNCSLYGWPSLNKQDMGVCALTSTEIVIMAGDSAPNQTDQKSKSIKFTDIERIGYKSKIRLHQFQLLSKDGLIVVSMSPNKQLVDGALTKKWYDFIVNKGVKEFVPDDYLQAPQTQYQIRYQ